MSSFLSPSSPKRGDYSSIIEILSKINNYSQYEVVHSFWYEKSDKYNRVFFFAMNPLLLLFEVCLNCILMPLWWIIGCIGYIYDWFNCKKVPIPKRILITGASSGIGRATAIEYANKVQVWLFLIISGYLFAVDWKKCWTSWRGCQIMSR